MQEELSPYQLNTDPVSQPVDLNAEQPLQQFAEGGEVMQEPEEPDSEGYYQQLLAQYAGYGAPQQTPVQGFAEGGSVSLDAMNALIAASEPQTEDEAAADYLSQSQRMLADLGPRTSPRQATGMRRVLAPSGGGAAAPKEMELAAGPLATGQDFAIKEPKAKSKGKGGKSAKEQLQALALQYKLKLRATENESRGLMRSTLGAPTLEQPTLTSETLGVRRFQKGGEAKKADEDFLKDIRSRAEEGTDYRAMLEYLQSRDAVPDIRTEYLPDDASAVFSTIKLPIGRGAIKLNKDLVGSNRGARIGPSTLAHEMAHAADRQMQQQAGEQTGLFSKGNQFTDAYERLVGPGGMREGQRRADLARKYHRGWVEQNKDYRAAPYEIAAHGVGNYAGPTTASKGPLHVDATAATEFQILLDLARRNSKGAVKRAEGSPKEGEVSDAELEAASRPAFVTPKSGKGRKRGPISDALNTGSAYVAAAKGASELPYDIAGAPVDIATMALRPLGYNVDKPVMGSDWIKQQMTRAGVRQAPPEDPTAKGFYTAGELMANVVNPAAVVRGGVRGAQRVGQAARNAAQDFQQYNRQLDVPGASYAVRPIGSTMLTGPVGHDTDVSEIDHILRQGRDNARSVAGQNVEQEELIKNFWDVKARNFFTRQFGTPNDPIAAAISKKQIKGSALDKLFPGYMIDQLSVGKTRVNDQGQERFFPKYPQAMEDFTSRYDRATGIQGGLITRNPAASEKDYTSLSREGQAIGSAAEESEADRMLMQGMRPELINARVGAVTRSLKDPGRVIGDGPGSTKDLYLAYEDLLAYDKMTPEQKKTWASNEVGRGRKLYDTDEAEVSRGFMGENVRAAIEKGEPIYDVGYMGRELKTLFNAENINTYLSGLSPRELANIRFEDAVRGGLKFGDRSSELEKIHERIRANKPVADTVYSSGVSAPLLQFGEGSGLDGFAWKRIEKREATVPEGAYVGHSVAGYELGGVGYTSDKRNGFNTGKWQIYTLRDNRNRPVNTIEVRMENTGPVVTQIKGNGRATGNTAPEKYDQGVLSFLQNYLKPISIAESDTYLTPLLQSYRDQLKTARP